MGAKAQGATTDRYMTIPRVLVFPFNDDGQILLLKGAPDKRVWAGLWNGIGGHVEKGESLIEAARRELFEETGLSAACWTLCGQVSVDTGSQTGIGFFVFRAEQLTGKLTESAEGCLRWFALDELGKFPLVEDLPILLGKAARTGTRGQPFWGVYRYDARDQLVMSFSA